MLNKNFWLLFSMFFVIRVYYNMFVDWQIEKFGFTGLEDLGRIIFLSVISVLEAALIALVLSWIWTKLINKFKKMIRKNAV